MSKNEITLQEKANALNTFEMSSRLSTIAKNYMSGNEIVVAQDSEGNEYLTSNIVMADGTVRHVNDINLAERLLEIKKGIAAQDASKVVAIKSLSKISTDDAEKLGFKSVDELALGIFNIAKSTAGNYRRIADAFIDDNGLFKGEIPKNCPILTLQACLPYVSYNEDGSADITAINEFFKKGIINEYMTTRKATDELKKVETVVGTENRATVASLDETAINNIVEKIAHIETPKTVRRKKTVDSTAIEVDKKPILVILQALTDITNAFGDNMSVSVESAIKTIKESAHTIYDEK